MNREFVLTPPPGGGGDNDSETRHRQDLVFDQAPLGLALVDTHGLLLRVNRAATEIAGRGGEDLVGTALSAIVHPADSAAVAAGVDALVDGTLEHLQAQTRLVHGDGRVVWVCVHASCVREEDGTPLCLVAQIEDITDSRRTVLALAEAEERFRTTFDRAPIGMILTDTEGTLIQVNPAYCRIVGRPASELIGQSVSELTHPDDREDNVTQVEALVAGTIDSFSLEKRYVHGDGRTVWTSVSASCVRNQTGQPLYLIGQVQDITAAREMRERLAHAAIHDPLTALPNRALFIDRLDVALRRAQRDGHRVAVMFLDLDRFKVVNDSLGHEVGDQLLRAVADRMKSALRASDTLARFGGDEFTVLCDEVADEAHALEIAERMRSTMREPVAVAGTTTFVSFSVGIALSTGDGDTGPSLLRRADVAMYRAKDAGPARVEIYTENEQGRIRNRLRTAHDLDGVLGRRELEIHYQPFVDLATRTMVAMEALVRWRHPSRGLLLPDEFIAMDDDGGLMVPLGAWALDQTCRQVALWNAGRDGAGMHEDRLNISVAVGASQLADPGFPDQVAGILAATGVKADRLWLQCTESTLMRDAEATVGVLHSLRDLGLHFGIDEFGAGFSSLAYLKRFPVEALKIDRSFVREVNRRAEDTAVVRACIGVAESLGLLAIAGGIERWDQVTALETLGCRIGQGYLLGRPLRPDAIGAFPTDDLGAWHGLLEVASP